MPKKAKRTFPDCAETMVWTNTTGSTVLGGTLRRVNNRLVMVYADIPNNKAGTVILQGEFAFAKGAGYTLAVGDPLTWDGTKMVKHNGAVATPIDAYCTEAAASNDTQVVGVFGCGGFGRPLVISKAASAGDDTNNYIEVVHGLGANPSAVLAQIKNVSNVYRVPAGAVTFPDVNTVRVADANLAVNEVLHIVIQP